MQERGRNPWKILISVIAGATVAFFVTRAVGAWFDLGRDPTAEVGREQAKIAASAPPVEAVDYCNRYAAEATHEPVQPAPAATLPGGESGEAAEDGAAPVGSDAKGTLVGLSYENSRSEPARTAYRVCMIREGYAS